MTHTTTPLAFQKTGTSLYDRPVNENLAPKAHDMSEPWMETLQQVYELAVDRYQDGHRGTDNVIPQTHLRFLESIGTSAQELYDFVEDWVDAGEPHFSTVAAITAVRREYFLTVQNQKPSDHVVETPSLPAGHEELGGYRWLPRIIAKGQAKLRGEMSPDIMFGCGADRPFLRKVGIDPADFLNLVWQAGDDHQAILDVVNRSAKTL